VTSPVATISLISEITQDQADKINADLQKRADAAQDRYLMTIEHIRQQNPELTDDQIEGVVRGQNQGLQSLVAIESAWRYARQIRKDCDLMAVRPREAKAVVIVADAYPIKDALKAIGYRWSEDARWMDVVGLKVKPGWTKTAEINDLKSEVETLKAMGCAIERGP